jgi:hypothetical protein
MLGQLGQDDQFQNWYSGWATQLGLSPDPYDPRHLYDYEAAWKAGAEPDEQGHWPSEFKLVGHPTAVVDRIDTRTGRIAEPEGIRPVADVDLPQPPAQEDRLSRLDQMLEALKLPDMPTAPTAMPSDALAWAEPPSLTPLEPPPPPAPRPRVDMGNYPGDVRTWPIDEYIAPIKTGLKAGGLHAIEALGGAAELAGRAGVVPMQYQHLRGDLIRGGQHLMDQAQHAAQQMPPLPAWEEIAAAEDGPAKVDAAIKWALGATSQALASVAASIAGGVVGSTAGPVGTVVGALGPSFILNQGEVRGMLRQEGLDQQTVDLVSTLAAIPMAALDALMPAGVAGKITAPARRSALTALSRFATDIVAKGAGLEGVTEGMQSVIGNVATALAAEKPVDIGQFLVDAIPDAIAGALVGGGVSTVADVARPQPTVRPPGWGDLQADILGPPAPTVAPIVSPLERGEGIELPLPEPEVRPAPLPDIEIPAPLPIREVRPILPEPIEPVAPRMATVAPQPVQEPITPVPTAPRPTEGRLTALEEGLAGLEPTEPSLYGEQAAARVPGIGPPIEPPQGFDLQPPRNVYSAPLEALTMAPQIFQFKRAGIGPAGVSRELSEVEMWDETLAGVVSVWHNPADNQIYVVNGHHRVDLAERLEVERLNIQFIEAANVEEARAAGAFINIAEGRGTPSDVGKFLRDMGATIETLTERGVSVRGDIARKGLALSRLSDDLFQQLTTQEMRETWGVAIGEMIPDNADLQREVFKAIKGKELSEAAVRETARIFRDAGTEETSILTLFGEETQVNALAPDVGRVAALIKSKMAADKRRFGPLAREADELETAGTTTIDREAVAARAEESKSILGYFDLLYTRAGPVGSLVTEGARRVVNGERIGAVVDDIYPRVADAVNTERQSLVPTEPVVEAAEGIEGVGALEAGPGERVRGEAGVVAEPTEPTAAALEEEGQEALFDIPRPKPKNEKEAVLQQALFGEAELVSGQEQRTLDLGLEVQQEAPAATAELQARVARVREKLSTPEEIERTRREGEEPVGEEPLPLLDREFRDELGPFEQTTATVTIPAKTEEVEPEQAREIKPISTVELTRLVTELIGEDKIFMRKYPSARGAFYADPADPRMGLNPALGKDYDQFAKTLAHEAGHLADFFDERTMDRGNILGRLASLRNYQLETIDATPTDAKRALKPKERAQIRRRAEKRVGKRPKEKAERQVWLQQVSQTYAEMIGEEMDSRRLLTREQIHEELLLLSEWWRPYDRSEASASFIKYRESSREIYADAISVLLNSPGTLQARAPTFFNAFFAYMEQKPEVAGAYDGIQELIAAGEEEIHKARYGEYVSDVERGEEIQRAYEARKDPQHILSYVEQLVSSKAAALYRAEGRRLKREEGERAAPYSEKREVKLAVQEYNHRNNVNWLMLDEVSEKVHKKLAQAGIDPKQAGFYLMHRRIAEGDRGGQAELAKEAIMDITGEKTWAEARAAYRQMLEGEEAVDPDLLEVAESGVLNPHGYTPEESRRNIRNLANELGEQKFETLQGLMRDFLDIVREPIQKAVEVGIISQEVYYDKIAPNMDTYVPFVVLDYFNGRVPAGMKRQIGTIKGVGDVYQMGVMKAMAMNRMVERQKAVLTIMDKIDTDFPGAAGPERIIDKFHREVPAEQGMRNVHYYRDGKLYYRAVDEYIARSLDQHDIGGLTRITNIMGTKLYGFFHPLYVTYSLAWQARNLMRDTKRTYRLMAQAHRDKPSYRQVAESIVDLGRLAKAYVETAGVAMGRAAMPYVERLEQPSAWWTKPLKPVTQQVAKTVRKHRAQVRAMLEDRSLGRAFHSFDPNDQDLTIERQMQQAGIVQSDGKNFQRKLRRAVLPAMVEGMGIFQETWSKAAAYKFLETQGITGRERAYMVRNYTGTPDSTERGLAADISNSLFMYYNVIAAGIRADVEVASDPKTAAGYWFRSVITDFAGKAVTAAAILGWMGDDVKEWLEHIADYDLEKYQILPIPPFYATNDKGEKKAIYARLPHDDVMRIVGAVTWALITGERPNNLTHAVGIAAGEMPGFSPPVTMLAHVLATAIGRPPYDSFRGRDIIPRTQWEAGGWHRWQELARHTLGEFGVMSQIANIALPNLIYAAPEEGETARSEDLIRRVPGLSSLVKVSNRGLNQERYWETQWEDRARARLRLDLDQSVRRATQKRNQFNRWGEEQLNEDQNQRRLQLNYWYRTYYEPLTAAMEGARDTKNQGAYDRARDILNESVKHLDQIGAWDPQEFLRRRQ